jgi:Cu(I)/Ag(I) efflux system membrane protein CusA/SilA
MQLPGWTNAWTMPIKTRVDMLATGVRTPVGIKVFGTDLAQIEEVGTHLEHLISPIPGTRSVLYERNLGGLYVDIIPKPDALARYGLPVAAVQDVIESAIGGTPIGTTIEGRNRFSINVRYPQDLRGDVDQLRKVLVPVPNGSGPAAPKGGGMPMGTEGAIWPPEGSTGVMLAQAMPAMGAQSSPRMGTGPGARPRLAGRPSMPDVPADMNIGGGPSMGGGSSGVSAGGMFAGGPGVMSAPSAPPGFGPGSASSSQAFVPLGELADIRIAGGPPMVRDEAGLLVGYVYVDIDQAQRDIGGYVAEAKTVVRAALARGDLALPQGYYLKWTGQYEQLEEMVERMKIVIPVTLGIVILLLYFQFRSFAEVLIVLLSIPFALVGSAWLLYLLDYRLSTAVWVGIIALVGLAAQTGIVMIVYIDHAFLRRKQAGRINDLGDIIAAHMEGTVQRVRPKLMTVATMLLGLIPLLWATTSGADVMKRIAAPMVGGLVTSAFLTLEIIPVVVTYWRYEQLLWEKLEALDPGVLGSLRRWTVAAAAGAGLCATAWLSRIYVEWPGPLFAIAVAAGGVLFAGGVVAYLLRRPAGRRIAWPARA